MQLHKIIIQDGTNLNYRVFHMRHAANYMLVRVYLAYMSPKYKLVPRADETVVLTLRNSNKVQ